MAKSERTRSVRAVRDTAVADHSTPRINTTRHVAYPPPIAVSSFLLALLVSYFKCTLWCCSQLWPDVGMGVLGTSVQRDCNAIGDAVKISPRVPSTCTQYAILSSLIIRIIPSCQIYVAIDNPSLVASVSRLTTTGYLSHYVRTADDVSHAENLQSNGCRCVSHLYKLQDRIQVTRVFRYCGERQG